MKSSIGTLGRRRPTRPTSFQRAIARVIDNGNCSGCGACAILSPAVTMKLSPAGFHRPVWETVDGASERAGALRTFKRICPGVGVTAPERDGREEHPMLGPYVSAWAAWAADEQVRFAGSSGGVLSALSIWTLAGEGNQRVLGAGQDPERPARTAVTLFRSRTDVLAATGSRYAPVSNAAALATDDRPDAFIGKPCEVYAVDRFMTDHGGQRPLLLSFFCAGVPSQQATTDLLQTLDVDPGELTSLRYRGNGWPGDFAATDRAGARASLSYQESWGAHLGRQLQSRCKICVDGTAANADISVGDYWQTDARGYPEFGDRPGSSVAIARTPRGHEALLAAQRDGAVVLEPIDLDSVAAVQPFQTLRRNTLFGRLVGRLAAGRSVPRYRGFGLTRLAISRPRQTVRFARGTRSRSRRGD